MEQAGGGSAERELATPETARQKTQDDEDGAPSAKAMETPTDKELPDDQQAMQPDTD